jgi:hypothetical protein
VGADLAAYLNAQIDASTTYMQPGVSCSALQAEFDTHDCCTASPQSVEAGECDGLKHAYRQKECGHCNHTWADLDTTLLISVFSVGGHSTRTVPEPYKDTTLCAVDTATCEADAHTYCWSIDYAPMDDEVNPPSVSHTSCGAPRLTHQFTHPGRYTVSVERNGQTVETTLRNLYARREIRDLDTDERALWADALWTIKRTSTEDGRARYTCPTGLQTDFHTHDYFVMIHKALSGNASCDQLHFSLYQEWAHQAWNTMLERSMQCVHPSVALVWCAPSEIRTCNLLIPRAHPPGPGY